MANSVRPEIVSRNIALKIAKRYNMDKIFDKTTLDQIGKLVVAHMRADAAAGISPITGAQYPAYKNARKYPGKRKPASPVNLRLKGAFLRTLRFVSGKKPKGFAINIGFSTELSTLKERGHREGANRQPKRPLIPRGRQNFRKEILDKVRQLIRQVVDTKRNR